MNREIQQLAEAYKRVLVRETSDDAAADLDLKSRIHAEVVAGSAQDPEVVVAAIMKHVEDHVTKQLAQAYDDGMQAAQEIHHRID